MNISKNVDAWGHYSKYLVIILIMMHLSKAKLLNGYVTIM